MQIENEAEGLLRAVGTGYAALRTYRDHGHVLRSGRSAPVVQFRTLFARDAGLRFEFTRDGRTEIVRGPTTDPEALMDALAGATGISAGAAVTIPALLLPEASEGAWSLLRLSEPRIIKPPRDQRPGERWTWVAGTGWAGQPWRVAIDPMTLLIRRLEDLDRDEIRSLSTTYEPDVIGSVESEELMSADPGGL